MNQPTFIHRRDGYELPGIYCPCLTAIVAEDLERGYHDCGRAMRIAIGPPGSAYDPSLLAPEPGDEVDMPVLEVR